MRIIELGAGERIDLSEPKSLFLVRRGQGEVYAVAEEPFCRDFIVAIEAQEAAFPWQSDDDDVIGAELYTETGATVEVIPFADCATERLHGLMTAWLEKLANIPWLARLLLYGDDALLAWRKDKALSRTDNLPELEEHFTLQNEIFLTLLELRHATKDKVFQRRQSLLAKNIAGLSETSLRLLLGEKVVEYADSGEPADEVLQEAEFIVRSAAQALNLPVGSVSLDPETAARSDPVTLLHLLAQKNNMMLRYVTLPKNWQRQDYGTMIGYIGKEKRLCLLSESPTNDYVVKTVKIPEGEIYDAQNENKRVYEAFVCYRGLPERKLDQNSLWEFLRQHLLPQDCRAIVLISLFMGLVPVAVPLLTEAVFTDAILLVNSYSLLAAAQVLAAIGLTMAALFAVRSVSALRLTAHWDMVLQAALVGRIMRLPIKTLRRFSSHDLTGRLERLSKSRHGAAEILTAAPDALFSLWSLGIMALYSKKIAVSIAAVTLLVGVFLYWYHRSLYEERRRYFQAGGRTAGITRQILAFVGKFRAQGALPRAFKLWSERFGQQEKLARDLRRREELPQILLGLRPFVLTAIICLPFSENFTRSQFIAFLVAVACFADANGRFFNVFGAWFELRDHLAALQPLLAAAPESVRAKSDAGKPDGSVEVSHLSFAYEDNENILTDVNFRLAPGEYVALVGKSGSGKSTLLRLMLGLETPQSGTVYYNGQDMAELNLSSLRSQLGVVLQDGELAAGDIFSNIAGAKPITEDEAWQAAEGAGIDEDIAAMPMGMHTIIDEGGANLSGGQRQRLQIAAALAKKPAVLLFDEATAALDNRTQAIVTATLNGLKATRLVIAHRLTTIKEADRILVLDKGKIAESGTFDALMAKNGIFAQLMEPQTQGGNIK